MPITTRIEADTGIVRYVITGEIKVQEVLSAVGSIYRDPAYPSPLRALCELAGAKPMLDADDVRSVVGFTGYHRPADAGRLAIVAPEDLSFGLSRMYEILSSEQGVETKVFRDVEAARRWLLSDDEGTAEE